MPNGFLTNHTFVHNEVQTHEFEVPVVEYIDIPVDVHVPKPFRVEVRLQRRVLRSMYCDL